jgi:hypothetical protein
MQDLLFINSTFEDAMEYTILRASRHSPFLCPTTPVDNEEEGKRLISPET